MVKGRGVGVDPGLSGALGVLSASGRIVLDVLEMPVLQSGKTKHVDGTRIAAFLDKWGVEHATIEQVQAMPDDGVAGAFRFGAAFGVVLGVIQARGIPYELVPPATWKRRAGLIGKPKEASHALAARLFPAANGFLYGPRGGRRIDVAEALLIRRSALSAIVH